MSDTVARAFQNLKVIACRMAKLAEGHPLRDPSSLRLLLWDYCRLREALEDIAWQASGNAVADWSVPDLVSHCADALGTSVADLMEELEGKHE